MNHDDLIPDDVLAAFGDVLAPTGAADTAARIATMAKRAAEEDVAAEEAEEAHAPVPQHVLRDVSTRLATPAALRAFVQGTEGDVVLVSRRTREWFTFEVTRPDVAHRRVRRRNDNRARRYVKLRSSTSVGYERPAFVGTLRLEASQWRGRTYPAGLHVGKHCDLPEGSPAVKAALWLFDRVVRGDDDAIAALLAQAEVYGEAV